jgi:Tfp pilus assembly protein PilF
MPALEACPLCRTTLRTPAEQCPDCGGDLRPFLATQQRIAELTQLARRLLAGGNTAEAQRLIPRLSQLGTVPPEVLRELNARLALANGDTRAARSLAQQLDGEDRAELQRQCDLLDSAQLQARELYNSALWLARQGSFTAAAEELQRAAGADPGQPAIWQLKLKTELKARLYSRCYASLAALDRLRARPVEFARLEALLPAGAIG